MFPENCWMSCMNLSSAGLCCSVGFHRSWWFEFIHSAQVFYEYKFGSKNIRLFPVHEAYLAASEHVWPFRLSATHLQRLPSPQKGKVYQSKLRGVHRSFFLYIQATVHNLHSLTACLYLGFLRNDNLTDLCGRTILFTGSKRLYSRDQSQERRGVWISKAKNTHSACVTFVDFPRQQWLRECASVLRYSTLPVLFNNQVVYWGIWWTRVLGAKGSSCCMHIVSSPYSNHPLRCLK
jgi:hypothetical protein